MTMHRGNGEPTQGYLFEQPPRSLEQDPTFKPFTYPVWTHNKARLVQRYLRYFVFITKHGTYIDGFVRAQKWLPTLPDAARDGTLRHLLTHTSGLIDYEDVMPEGLTEQLRDADVLRLLESQQRTYFAPEAETSPNQGSP